MHSWIFRNRARLGIVYGISPVEATENAEANAPAKRSQAPALAPGKVLKTSDGVLLGPWGRRRA